MEASPQLQNASPKSPKCSVCSVVKLFPTFFLSVISAVKIPLLLLLSFFSACEQRVTVTVPRPVYAICAETPCRVPIAAIRGSVLRGEKRPHNVLIDVRDFAARQPRQSPFKFSSDERRKAAPGRLDLWIQTGTESERFHLNPSAGVTLKRLLFPQAPPPGVSAVFRPRREAPGPFRCGARADAGTWFSVSWTPAVHPAPPIRKPSIVMETAAVWAPMQVFIPEGRHFVFSRFPAGRPDHWMALFACLGPVSLVEVEPGRITTAQVAGVSLWQWATPEGPHWKPLLQALEMGRGAAEGAPMVAAAVQGRRTHAEVVESPVDFLVKMLAAGHLTREEAWAAWTRLLLAGVPAAEFEALRESLTSLPE